MVRPFPKGREICPVYWYEAALVGEWPAVNGGKRFDAVVLVETEDGYQTSLVMGDGKGNMWADAPLTNFEFGDFPPKGLKRWAVLDFMARDEQGRVLGRDGTS